MKAHLIKVLALILIFVGVFYFTKKPAFSGHFEVKDLSSELPGRMIQDFGAIVAVNLDDEPEQEILIAGYGGPNRMMKLQNKHLKEINIPELSDDLGNNYAISACDLNGDGRDELLFINDPSSQKNSHSQIFRYQDGLWKGLLRKNDPLIARLDLASSATCIDRKGSQQFGFFISSKNGNSLFLEESHEGILDVAPEIGLAKKAQGRSVIGIMGPTGFMNLFQSNEGKNFYFVNDNKGSFVEKAQEANVTDELFDSRGAYLIDENHDDLPDLVYGNHYGPPRLMKQKRDGTFMDATPEVFNKNYAINSITVMDLNLDGESDVYGNILKGSNFLFSKSRGEWFSVMNPHLEEKELPGVGTLVGDLDQNPGIEILNTHGDGRESRLTLVTIKPELDWVDLRVEFQNGGIPRGAKIILKTSKRARLFSINTGTGRYGEQLSSLYTGLFKDENIQSVEVTLPGGKVFNYPLELKRNRQHVIVLKP